MNWDETRVLDAEIGRYISLARRSGDQWFVGALADEEGLKSCISLDFLEEGLVYDVTLYEDAPDAHYEFLGPENKGVARANNLEMKPHKTRRELYQVKKITAKKADLVPIVIAPGGGHCMWIRPANTQTGISGWPVLKTYDQDHIQIIQYVVQPVRRVGRDLADDALNPFHDIAKVIIDAAFGKTKFPGTLGVAQHFG